MTTILVTEIRLSGQITGPETTRLMHHIGAFCRHVESARVIGKTTQPHPIRDTLDVQANDKEGNDKHG
jgi:hypothetical protein